MNSINFVKYLSLTNKIWSPARQMVRLEKLAENSQYLPRQIIQKQKWLYLRLKSPFKEKKLQQKVRCKWTMGHFYI